MFRLSRRVSLIAIAAIGLSACGAADSSNAQGNTGSDDVALTDIVLGTDDAPITIVEYASWTCPACLQFHRDVIPMLKSDYVQAGHVKFIFREFPTPPTNVAVAGFALARCSGEDSYYDVIDDLFAAQPGILNLVRARGDIESELRAIGANYGIEGDGFQACLNNQDVTYAIVEAVEKGESEGVNSTPTVFVDGQQLQGYEWRSADGMKALLDSKLGLPETPETVAE